MSSKLLARQANDPVSRTAHIPLLVDIVHTDITLYASNITQQYITIFTNQFNDTSL